MNVTSTTHKKEDDELSLSRILHAQMFSKELRLGTFILSIIDSNERWISNLGRD